MRLARNLARDDDIGFAFLPVPRSRAARLSLLRLRKQTNYISLIQIQTRRWCVACLLPLLLLALPSLAQNSITFTAEVTTGVETVTPVLTWSTTPVADDCVASGNWAGSKGPFGTEMLLPIVSGATYNLTCNWLASDVVTLTWTPPTQNTDGTPLTDLAGFKISYGQTPGGPYPNIHADSDLNDPTVTTHDIEGLASGNWFFVAVAFNDLGVDSDFSNEAMKVLGAISVEESVGIVVNPKPNAPTGLDVQ